MLVFYLGKISYEIAKQSNSCRFYNKIIRVNSVCYSKYGSGKVALYRATDTAFSELPNIYICRLF